MQTYYRDGSVEEKEFATKKELLTAAGKAANDPEVEKIVLHLPKPKLRIPGKKKKGA